MRVTSANGHQPKTPVEGAESPYPVRVAADSVGWRGNACAAFWWPVDGAGAGGGEARSERLRRCAPPRCSVDRPRASRLLIFRGWGLAPDCLDAFALPNPL